MPIDMNKPSKLILSSTGSDLVFVKYLVFPVLLSANIALIYLSLQQNWPLEAVFSIALVANLALLYLLERKLPYRPEWAMNSREFIQDLGYFGLISVLCPLVQLGIGALAIFLATPMWEAPLLFSTLGAILVAELADYGFHWISHRNAFFWKVHSIHHVPEKVNLLSNNTTHFLSIVFGTSSRLIPLVLLGFPQDPVFIAVSLLTLHSYIVHLNADIRFGWLGYIFLSPAHHRMHHSTHVPEALNFGVMLTVWDHLFGTFHYQQEAPRKVGVEQPEEYPKPWQLLRCTVFPFRKEGDGTKWGGSE